MRKRYAHILSQVNFFLTCVLCLLACVWLIADYTKVTAKQDLGIAADTASNSDEVTDSTEEDSTEPVTEAAEPRITYSAAAAGNEFTKNIKDGKTAGSGNKNIPIATFKLKLSGKYKTGTVQYRFAMEEEEFGNWISSGKIAGSPDASEGFSRVQLRLTGELAKDYDIYYRVRIVNYGWLGWSANGKQAGTEGMVLPITGIQIRLVKKTEPVTLSPKNNYLIAKKQKFVIKVNKKMNCVTVYLNNKPVKVFVCSTGRTTPLGTFYTPARWRWLHMVHNVWGQFVTQIRGNYLFHSTPYKKRSNDTLIAEEYNKLGTRASAGCIRLTSRDAKWIYDNCMLRTKVIIFNGDSPGPLGKPKIKKIPEDQNWDPTDPTVDNPE